MVALDQIENLHCRILHHVFIAGRFPTLGKVEGEYLFNLTLKVKMKLPRLVKDGHFPGLINFYLIFNISNGGVDSPNNSILT